MSLPVKLNRPQSAPIKHVSFSEEKSDVERCIFCMRKIFQGAFAQVSDIVVPEKREPLCSLKCLNLYTKTNETGKEPTVPLPVPLQVPSRNIAAIAHKVKQISAK